MQQAIHKLLKQHKLNITAVREKILGLFIGQPEALSHSDIEKLAGEKFDRVTVYRTLQSFQEKGIIHVIPTPDSTIRYAICANDCTYEKHNDEHIHFSCTVCKNIYCLDHVDMPKIKMPGGYLANDIQVIVNGVCKNCN